MISNTVALLPDRVRAAWLGGNRVLQVNISGTQVETTAYAGALEVAISSTARSTKTYYSAGSQLIAMRVATSTAQSTLYFLSSDHLGSSSLTTDASGNVVARQLYDAWGNIRSGGGMPTDIGFSGQRLDSGTNLLFMHARYYDSQIGRWLSPDSIIPDESNPQSLNRYSYVENGPLNHTDPTGHMASDGCQIEGCQNDRGHEIDSYTKYLRQHNNVPLAELTLFWYGEAKKNLASWRPEMDGPLTAEDDPFLLALQATNQDIQDHPDQSPDQINGVRHALGTLINIGVAFGADRLMANSNAVADAYVGSYSVNEGREINLPFNDSELRNQIQNVVDTMYNTGSPPVGVSQGGALDVNGNFIPGLFQNRQGILPSQPEGYYTESDVWPGWPRGTERLVFGDNGEVYYTNDHYTSFVQIR